MKTNQIMIRQMGEFDVSQRTKDGMFNATTLLKQWNEHSGMKKEIKDFFSNKNTQAFIKTLENDKDFIIGGIPPMKKSRANKGANAGTWLHPYLFIKFAMWINPKFELEVIKFVYDQLIKFRHKAGDFYMPFCKAINKIYPNCDFSEPAKWLNYVIFGKHQRDIRNQATQYQLDELAKLQKKYTDLIEEGYIRDVIMLKSKLRIEWRNRHSDMPRVLA